MTRRFRWSLRARSARRLLAASLVFHALPATATAQVRADVYISGLAAPVAFVQDPSAAAVQYIVEQGGRIRVVRNGVLQSTSFLDLTADISSGGERGLLGLALSPDYETSGRFYVNFTNPAGHTVIARFKRSSANPFVADPATRFDFRWPGGDRFITQPFANHNGGTLMFGPDGFLYIGLGDGGSGDDPFHNAQNPASLLGKMLRLDVNVPDSDVEGYDIPAGNPFVSGAPVPALPEIWAFGLRNPWKFSFDDPARGGTGALIIADVGQGAWEEIDYEPAGRGGRNYGWRNREGAHPHVTNLPLAYQPPVDPIFEYGHGIGQSITGGFVYRGAALGSSMVGRYFFADISARVWSLTLTVDPATGEAVASGLIEHTAELGGSGALGLVSSFGVDASGELYLVNHTQGRILRLSSSVPIAVDTDHDGLPDSWELQYGLNPNIAAGNNGANGDPDGDGFTNLQEFQRGSNPTRARVWPHLLDLNSDRGGDVLLYNRASGERRFEVTNRLTTGFTQSIGFWDPAWQIHPANLNGDEYTDFFLYDPVRGLWVQALNHRGDGTFTYTLGNWDSSWTVMPADFDGDRLTDMLVYNVTTGVWVKCFVDGGGGFKGYAGGNLGPWVDVDHVGSERRRSRRFPALQPGERRLGRGVQPGGFRHLRLPVVWPMGSGLAGDPCRSEWGWPLGCVPAECVRGARERAEPSGRRLRLRRRAAMGAGVVGGSRRSERRWEDGSLPLPIDDRHLDRGLQRWRRGLYLRGWAVGSGLGGGIDRLQRRRPGRPAAFARGRHVGPGDQHGRRGFRVCCGRLGAWLDGIRQHSGGPLIDQDRQGATLGRRSSCPSRNLYSA